MKLQWKVAVVTGAADPVGAAAARLFAGEGATVVCADADHHGANAVVNEITAAGGRGLALTVDVSVEEEVRGLFDRTVEEFGRLDVLFNHAALFADGDGDAESTNEDVWDRTMAVNAKGAWFGCRYGIPAMRDTGGGSIINTAGVAALVGLPTAHLAWTASKGAVLAMTRELAVRHAAEGIRANALCPGPRRAPADQPAVPVPMGRPGEPDEIARAVLFLASDDSSYLTGTVLTVDGGLTAAAIAPA